MNRKIGAIVSATITLLIFTVLPLYAPSLLPPELGEILKQAGLNLYAFLNQVALIGVVVAFLTLVKGFVPKTSPVSLLASIASSIMMLGLTLLTLSLGDLGNLGLTTISLEVEGGLNTAVLDLRLFIQLAVLTVTLKFVHSILEFMDARAQKAQIVEIALD
jgi:hypothetical protein